MAEQQMGKPGVTRLLEQWWVKVVLTGIIVLLVVALILRLQGQRDIPAPETPAPAQTPILAETPPDPLTVEPDTEPGKDSPEPAQGSDEAFMHALPRIATQVAETPDDSDKERVVIEDRVVSRLLQREQGLASGHTPAPARPTAEQTHSSALNTITMSLLSEMAPERYTLQLRAGRNLAVLDHLVLKHTLTPAWIYPKTIDDQPWFVLVFGSFDSAEQARRAVSMLPLELQSTRPWPKTFGQVQKEARP